MKLIIAGSRNIPKEVAFWKFLQSSEPGNSEFSLNLWFADRQIKEFVTGCCPTGPDQVPYMLASWWETSGYGLQADIVEFPADWNTHGKAAGPIRNRKMAEYADALLLIWDGKSRGSTNMYNEMRKLDKPVFQIIVCRGEE